MNLFDMDEDIRKLPLASRMRPVSIDEIVGQQHIIGKDKLLYRAIKADRLGSIILYGPPGVGKTTIARVIANTTNSHFCKLNATNAGIKDVEKIIEEAKFNQPKTDEMLLKMLEEKISKESFDSRGLSSESVEGIFKKEFSHLKFLSRVSVNVNLFDEEIVLLLTYPKNITQIETRKILNSLLMLFEVVTGEELI